MMNDADLARSCERWGITDTAAAKKEGLDADTSSPRMFAERVTNHEQNDNQRTKGSQGIFHSGKKRQLDYTPLDASLVAGDTRPHSIFDLRICLGSNHLPRANEINPVLKRHGKTYEAFFKALGYRPYNYRKLTKAELIFLIDFLENSL